MEVVNFDGIFKKDKKKEKKDEENILIPKQPFRMLICGASNSGKTNLLLNLLMRYIEHDKLYMISKHPDQDKYKLLQEFYQTIEADPQLAEYIDKPIATFVDSLDKMTPVDKLKKQFKNIIVFDDMVSETNQKPIVDAFIHGRHSGASVIYLTQSYFAVPKTIRINCSHFAFFECPTENEFNQIARDQCTDLDKKDFKHLFSSATEEPYNFFFIDKYAKQKPLKYRRNFDELLIE
jgi:hypothetical protein